jgi:hypothetical protein
VKPGRPKNRPCVVIAGGREPSQWEKYPHHRYLETNGALLCCDNGGCWKARCQPVGDGDEKDLAENRCLKPVAVAAELVIPRCLDMITAEDVIRAVESYYEGGALSYLHTQYRIDNLESSQYGRQHPQHPGQAATPHLCAQGEFV